MPSDDTSMDMYTGIMHQMCFDTIFEQHQDVMLIIPNSIDEMLLVERLRTLLRSIRGILYGHHSDNSISDNLSLSRRERYGEVF